MVHHGHDHGYKLLFSHPEMMADLIRGYVRAPWVEQLDFNSLEKVNGSYISDDLRSREDDVIWRLRWEGEARWLYVYLLLEFQSSPERFMALRVLTYLGLLYEDLRRSGQLSADGLLPPVLPVVLYRGSAPWQEPRNITELIDGGLWRFLCVSRSIEIRLPARTGRRTGSQAGFWQRAIGRVAVST
ncbi:Rpn family recombination-promoting nuclease/putative transposase, partial [Spiribacter sp. 221]|uniref:Rpn family recombination-promoting nuclease/putative transposase n=1 Tax=Spiribacter onubensis TaxID=3122420 RepID=UPI00349FB3D0